MPLWDFGAPGGARHRAAELRAPIAAKLTAMAARLEAKFDFRRSRRLESDSNQYCRTLIRILAQHSDNSAIRVATNERRKLRTARARKQSNYALGRSRRVAIGSEPSLEESRLEDSSPEPSPEPSLEASLELNGWNLARVGISLGGSRSETA